MFTKKAVLVLVSALSLAGCQTTYYDGTYQTYPGYRYRHDTWNYSGNPWRDDRRSGWHDGGNPWRDDRRPGYDRPMVRDQQRPQQQQRNEAPPQQQHSEAPRPAEQNSPVLDPNNHQDRPDLGVCYIDEGHGRFIKFNCGIKQ